MRLPGGLAVYPLFIRLTNTERQMELFQDKKDKNIYFPMGKYA